MEEEKNEAQPILSDYKGKPILRIPTVDEPNPDTYESLILISVWPCGIIPVK